MIGLITNIRHNGKIVDTNFKCFIVEDFSRKEEKEL